MAFLGILLYLTFVISVVTPSEKVGDCSNNTIKLKHPTTHKDIVNNTYCGPIQVTSYLSQLPTIETINLLLNVRNYTVIFTGPHGIDFLAVNCSFMGRSINVQSGTILKMYHPPARTGRYSVFIYSQNGSRIDTGVPMTSALEWIYGQKGVVLSKANSTTHFSVDISHFSPANPRGLSNVRHGAGTAIKGSLFIFACSALMAIYLR